MVGLRVGLAYLVAIGTALVVEWQWRIHGKRLLHPSVTRGLTNVSVDDNNGIARRSWGERINNITQTALHDFVDILAFLILGAVLATGGKFVIKESNVQEFIQTTPAVAILIMMGIAVLFCLCSEADAFVASNFPLFWPDGAKLAFLVLGPMLDLKLLLMYTRVFRGRLIVTIVTCLIVQVFAYTTIAHYLFGKDHPPETPPFIMPPVDDAYLRGMAMGPDPWTQLVHFGVALRREESVVGKYMDYGDFLITADTPASREENTGKAVEIKGEFEPTRAGGGQMFNLARFKITCCGNDATTLRVRVMVREPFADYKKGDWVKVSGRIAFHETSPGRFEAILMVSNAGDIRPSDPDLNPYVQQR
jgi:hypothetical protein